MPWPTPQDYNEALQHPARAFADRALAAGVPELTPLGLPRPVTGNFASVYRLRGPAGDWAVRCFFRPTDLGGRYAVLDKALAGFPYTVGFSYLEHGVRVRSAWYPILKMTWVEGDLLSEWIGARLGDGKALRRLAGRWRAFASALEAGRIAHGDLQHGNVLIVRGEIRLVDYDGMWVPDLDGQPAREIGHPNYQHPGRDAGHSGPDLDRFSHWLIYGSLLALAEAPDLWDGDECLILRRTDLRDPARSAILARLRRHPAGACRALAAQIETLLALAPDRLPPLGDLAAPPARIAPGWLSDYLPQRPAFSVHLPQRAALALLLALAPILAADGTLPAAGMAILATLLLLATLYAGDPAMIARIRLGLRIHLQDRRCRRLTRRLARLRVVRAGQQERGEGRLAAAARVRAFLRRRRLPDRCRAWCVAELDRRIRSILLRHNAVLAHLDAKIAGDEAAEEACRRALAAERRTLAGYDHLTLVSFLRALAGLDGDGA